MSGCRSIENADSSGLRTGIRFPKFFSKKRSKQLEKNMHFKYYLPMRKLRLGSNPLLSVAVFNCSSRCLTLLFSSKFSRKIFSMFFLRMSFFLISKRSLTCSSRSVSLIWRPGGGGLGSLPACSLFPPPESIADFLAAMHSMTAKNSAMIWKYLLLN